MVSSTVTRGTRRVDAEASRLDEGQEGKLFSRDACVASVSQALSWEQLDTPEHEIVQISGRETDEEATEKVKKTLQAMSEGRYGKKVLLKIESE